MAGASGHAVEHLALATRNRDNSSGDFAETVFTAAPFVAGSTGLLMLVARNWLPCIGRPALWRRSARARQTMSAKRDAVPMYRAKAAAVPCPQRSGHQCRLALRVQVGHPAGVSPIRAWIDDPLSPAFAHRVLPDSKQFLRLRGSLVRPCTHLDAALDEPIRTSCEFRKRYLTLLGCVTLTASLEPPALRMWLGDGELTHLDIFPANSRAHWQRVLDLMAVARPLAVALDTSPPPRGARAPMAGGHASGTARARPPLRLAAQDRLARGPRDRSHPAGYWRDKPSSYRRRKPWWLPLLPLPDGRAQHRDGRAA